MDNLMTFLRDYAFSNQIGYQFDSIRKPDQAPKSDFSLRVVFMNNNWKNPNEIPFQFAHEISHILNGDSGSNNFCASSIYIKEEYAANKRATEILLEYCDLNNLAYFDSVKFMLAFGIPLKVGYVVDEVFKERFGIQYSESYCEM